MMYCGDPVAAWTVASSDSDSGQGPPCEEAGHPGAGLHHSNNNKVSGCQWCRRNRMCLFWPRSAGGGGRRAGAPAQNMWPRTPANNEGCRFDSKLEEGRVDQKPFENGLWTNDDATDGADTVIATDARQ